MATSQPMPDRAPKAKRITTYGKPRKRPHRSAFAGNEDNDELPGRASTRRMTPEPSRSKRAVPDRKPDEPVAQESPSNPHQGQAGNLKAHKAPNIKAQALLSINKRREEDEGVTADIQKPRAARPSHAIGKRRLIDALVNQSASGDEAPEEENSDGTDDFDATRDSTQGSSQTTEVGVDTYTRIGHAPKPASIKFTYSSQRTLLAAPEELEEGTGLLGMNTPIAGRTGNLSQLPSFSFGDDSIDEVEQLPTTMRSIHELRQAGASNRFADEMDDLLDRVASANSAPSMRRNALLELSQKLNDKGFRRQFRDHGADTRLFSDIQKESDLVSGVAMASILLIVLNTSKGSHISSRIQSNDLANLLSILLDEQSTLSVISKNRKHNLSRNGQKQLVNLEIAILGLSIWDGNKPGKLSPRTVALKCLELVFDQGYHTVLENVTTSAVTDKLFEVLASIIEARAWHGDEDDDHEDIVDLTLTLSSLEACSTIAMESPGRMKWTSSYLPVVVQSFKAWVEQPSALSSCVRNLVVRLALNTTNNNPEAVDMFIKAGIMAPTMIIIRESLDSATQATAVESFSKQDVDDLVLLLGVMINFCEHRPDVRESIGTCKIGNQSPVEDLVRLFLLNHSRTSEADSLEKNQVNVVFGYLSILLGYLCLVPSVMMRFKTLSIDGNVDTLLQSLREFVNYHRAVEGQMHGEGTQTGGFSKQVENLVCTLNQVRLD